MITAVAVRTGSVERGRCSEFVDSPVHFTPAWLFVCLQGRAVGVGAVSVGHGKVG